VETLGELNMDVGLGWIVEPLCLSLGTRRTADRNVIVRRLPSIETLGESSMWIWARRGLARHWVSRLWIETNSQIVETLGEPNRDGSQGWIVETLGELNVDVS
jgi:hypothetical protein